MLRMPCTTWMAIVYIANAWRSNMHKETERVSEQEGGVSVDSCHDVTDWC